MNTPPDYGRPARDFAKEKMYPTTMHGTRDQAVIRDPLDRSMAAIGGKSGTFISRLGDKVIDYLHRLAL